MLIKAHICNTTGNVRTKRNGSCFLILGRNSLFKFAMILYQIDKCLLQITSAAMRKLKVMHLTASANW